MDRKRRMSNYVPCRYCLGQGKVRGRRCRECGGTGSLTVADAQSKEQKYRAKLPPTEAGREAEEGAAA